MRAVGKEVLALHGGHPRAEHHVAVAGRVHDHLARIELAAGFVFDDQALAVTALHHGLRDDAVQEQLHALVHDHLHQHHGEYVGRVSRDVARLCALARLAVLPFLGDRIIAVADRGAQQLLGHAEYDLPAAAVAHGHEKVDQPQRGQPAQHQALFNNQYGLALPPGRQRRAHARHAAARHNHVERPHDRHAALLFNIIHCLNPPVFFLKNASRAPGSVSKGKAAISRALP